MGLNIAAVFKFFARNPPSIAIAGAVLMWLVASMYQALGQASAAATLNAYAPWVFFGGLALQIAWLFIARH
jgi:hypothetical protein